MYIVLLSHVDSRSGQNNDKQCLSFLSLRYFSNFILNYLWLDTIL